MEQQNVIRTIKVSKLSIKEQTPRASGVTKAIRERLGQVPEGQAIKMQDLAAFVHNKFPQSIPDLQQAYVRINHALKTLKGKYTRYENLDDGRTYVGPL